MGNDNEVVPNPALRQYATSQAFGLSVSRNQAAVLEAIAHGRREARLSRNDWVSPARALGLKGMLEHRHAPNWVGVRTAGRTPDPITNYYRLTRAGWLVFDLLVEAGLAEPLASRSRLRRLVA